MKWLLALGAMLLLWSGMRILADRKERRWSAATYKVQVRDFLTAEVPGYLYWAEAMRGISGSNGKWWTVDSHGDEYLRKKSVITHLYGKTYSVWATSLRPNSVAIGLYAEEPGPLKDLVPVGVGYYVDEKALAAAAPTREGGYEVVSSTKRAQVMQSPLIFAATAVAIDRKRRLAVLVVMESRYGDEKKARQDAVRIADSIRVDEARFREFLKTAPDYDYNSRDYRRIWPR